MHMPTRRQVLGLLLAAPAVRYTLAETAGEWIPLFDGKSLSGWKASERAGAFSAADGQIVVHGGRSHLFYTGPVQGADFKNFELIGRRNDAARRQLRNLFSHCVSASWLATRWI